MAAPDAAAIAAALAQMLAGDTEADVEAELHQLEAKELVKDFTKSDGPTHYSGEGEDRLKRWIDYKERLLGSLRRGHRCLKYLFRGENCNVSKAHNAVFDAHLQSGREIIFEVLEMTLSGPAKGCLKPYRPDLRGDQALAFLESKYIRGDMRERTTTKDHISNMDFGNNDPEKKLQELRHLMEMRNHHLNGNYGDEERIADLLATLKKNKNYNEFVKTHNVIDTAGVLHLDYEEFIQAIQKFWEDHISKQEKNAN